MDIRRSDYDKSTTARTTKEVDVEVNEDEEADNIIRLLDESEPTEQEAYIEELFAKDVFAAADKAVDGPQPPMFSDVDETGGFWETQYAQATPRKEELSRDNVDASGGGDATNHTGSPKTPENSVHGSDTGLKKTTGNLEDRLCNVLTRYRVTPQRTTGQTPEFVLKTPPRTRLDILRPSIQNLLSRSRPTTNSATTRMQLNELIISQK